MNAMGRSGFSLGAAATLALSLGLNAVCSAQGGRPQTPQGPPQIANPDVFVNPRAGADDPRIGLKPGMHDAAEAAMGLQLLTTIHKPAILDPAPPAVVPGAPPVRGGGNGLTYANSDLAFGGNYTFMGNFYGITIYDTSNPAQSKLVTTIVCPGGQGDVSVYGHLLFMSVEGGGRKDCGTEPFPTAPRPAPAAAPAGEPGIAGTPGAGARARGGARPPEVAQADRIRGIRIFDISDIKKPTQVAMVQTCRGSHTHTLVPDPRDKDAVYVYIAGSAGVRPAEELAGCEGGGSDDPNTALFTIVVIKVPLSHPELAKVVNSPRIFSDPATGKMDALVGARVHNEGTAEPRAISGCHDITVYPAIGLAAGACSGNGIVLDIKDPEHPKRLYAVSDPNFSFWHSANFSNDGSKLIFTDEWGGGTQAKCRASDPMQWGADTIFALDKSTGHLTLDSYYKMPAAQTELENCVAHNGSFVPIPGRDILVQGWYQGGVSMYDYTDPKHPFEIAYFDRGPVDKDQMLVGGDWAAYWYNGSIIASEIARGLDVFKMVPTKYISQNEIDAANQVHFNELNPQNQPMVTWPKTMITAKAYVDQLARGTSIPADKMAQLKAAVDSNNTRVLKAAAPLLEQGAATAATPADAMRMKALAAIFKQ